MLVGAGAVEEDVVIAREFLGHGDGDGDRVSDSDRFDETDRLIDQDGSRAWKFGSQCGRNQRGAPHVERLADFDHTGNRISRPGNHPDQSGDPFRQTGHCRRHGHHHRHRDREIPAQSPHPLRLHLHQPACWLVQVQSKRMW